MFRTTSSQTAVRTLGCGRGRFRIRWGVDVTQDIENDGVLLVWQEITMSDGVMHFPVETVSLIPHRYHDKKIPGAQDASGNTSNWSIAA